MAVAVIEQLEVIDIDHQQCQVVAGLLGAQPFEIEPALEAASIGEA